MSTRRPRDKTKMGAFAPEKQNGKLLTMTSPADIVTATFCAQQCSVKEGQL